MKFTGKSLSDILPVVNESLPTPTNGRFVGRVTVFDPTSRWKCHVSVTPILLGIRSYLVVFRRLRPTGLLFDEANTESTTSLWCRDATGNRRVDEQICAREAPDPSDSGV
jgi:hypothetical protein